MKYFFFCFLLFISSVLYGQDRVDHIREKLLDRNSREVLVTSHRAGWRAAPENSLAAIAASIKIDVDIIELDVQQTKDGQLVLMHDQTLDRTTTGKGKVSAWTLDSLKTLKLKNGAGIRTKYTIPTLEEALLLSKGKVLVNLDKAYNFFDQVYALTEKTGTTRQIIMKGTQAPAIVQRDFGQYLDKVIYMPIINLDKKGAMELIRDFQRALNPVAFEFLYVSDTNPLPKQLARKLEGKQRIWYNTLWDTMAGGHDDDQSWENIDQGYGYLIDTLHAGILQTDRPKLLLDYIHNKSL